MNKYSVSVQYGYMLVVGTEVSFLYHGITDFYGPQDWTDDQKMSIFLFFGKISQDKLDSPSFFPRN